MSDRGSGSVIALALLGLVLAAALSVVGLASALAARQRVIDAADASALAAADVVSGAIGGSPCDQAARVALRGGARLVRCDIDGAIARIEVAAPVLGVSVTARARAGPPPTAPGSSAVG